jgi:cbb3-type cytochrome oxidase subunit 3
LVFFVFFVVVVFIAVIVIVFLRQNLKGTGTAGNGAWG